MTGPSHGPLQGLPYNLFEDVGGSRCGGGGRLLQLLNGVADLAYEHNALFPDALFVRNVIVGGDASVHPPDNFFPRSVDQVGFMDRERGDYRLAKSSRYTRVTTDGKDAGVDFSEARMDPP